MYVVRHTFFQFVLLFHSWTSSLLVVLLQKSKKLKLKNKLDFIGVHNRLHCWFVCVCETDEQMEWYSTRESLQQNVCLSSSFSFSSTENLNFSIFFRFVAHSLTCNIQPPFSFCCLHFCSSMGQVNTRPDFFHFGTRAKALYPAPEDQQHWIKQTVHISSTNGKCEPKWKLKLLTRWWCHVSSPLGDRSDRKYIELGIPSRPNITPYSSCTLQKAKKAWDFLCWQKHLNCLRSPLSRHCLPPRHSKTETRKTQHTKLTHPTSPTRSKQQLTIYIQLTTNNKQQKNEWTVRPGQTNWTIKKLWTHQGGRSEATVSKSKGNSGRGGQRSTSVRTSDRMFIIAIFTLSSSFQKKQCKKLSKDFLNRQKNFHFFFTCTHLTNNPTTNKKNFHINRFVVISMVNSTIWRNCSKWAVTFPIRTTCLWVISLIEASTVSKPFSCC